MTLLRPVHALAWLLTVYAAIAMATAQADPAEGQDYVALKQPQPLENPGKVEVIEFFSFGCTHCNHFEPAVEAWAASQPRDVAFVREHVNYDGRTDWEPFARLANTLKTMDKLDIMAQRVFNAVHRDNIELRDESTRLAWIAKQGLDAAKFKSIWHSMGMDAQMNHSMQMSRDYQATSVPYFVVDGKYVVQPMAGDPDGHKMFATINQLVTRERKLAHH
jgi:thiol:disulfide interchange protein DsbA